MRPPLSVRPPGRGHGRGRCAPADKSFQVEVRGGAIRGGWWVEALSSGSRWRGLLGRGQGRWGEDRGEGRCSHPSTVVVEPSGCG